MVQMQIGHVGVLDSCPALHGRCGNRAVSISARLLALQAVLLMSSLQV